MKWFIVADFLYAWTAKFTTTEQNEAAFWLFCELGISSQDYFCL